MISVLDEISKLRNGKPIVIDYNNNNRYRIVLKENDSSKTAYYFSTPIYNNRSKKVVELRFQKRNDTIFSVGSNTAIAYTDSIRLENAEGYCVTKLGSSPTMVTNRELVSGLHHLYPTTNGFVCKTPSHSEGVCFELEVGKPFMETRTNNKYFSLMSERFRPFLTVSGIGTVDDSGEIIAPVKLNFLKINDRKFDLKISPCSPFGKWMMFEFNLYENKLIQDTTVESKNATSNNAFGSTAFIGNSSEYGEQWLYSRPDFQKFSDLSDKRLTKAILHLPRYNRSKTGLSAFMVSARFCSFGSTWGYKIPASNSISNSVMVSDYQDIDITSLIIDKAARLVRSEGIILKSEVRDSGFSVIATGDSCYAPQIYEINFR